MEEEPMLCNMEQGPKLKMDESPPLEQEPPRATQGRTNQTQNRQ